MKKIMFFLLIALIGQGSIKAQIAKAPASVAKVPTPNIKPYFPKLTWKGYIERKGVIMYLDYYELNIPDSLTYLYGSKEEDDSLFQIQIVNYLKVKENSEQVIKWIMAYGEKFPALKNHLTIDDILATLKDSLGACYSDEFISEIESLKSDQE